MGILPHPQKPAFANAKDVSSQIPGKKARSISMKQINFAILLRNIFGTKCTAVLFNLIKNSKPHVK